MFVNKIIILLLGIALLFVTACDKRNTNSETNKITYTLDRKEPSAMFWDYAASTSMLQIELGKLATEKSEDTLIKAFADSALLIHSKALRNLQTIAGKYKHVQLPDSLSGSDREMVGEFEVLQEEEFDRRYLEYLTLNHRAQLNRYQETLSETEDPALRQWLNNMQLRLRNQLQVYTTTDPVTGIKLR